MARTLEEKVTKRKCCFGLSDLKIKSFVPLVGQTLPLSAVYTGKKQYKGQAKESRTFQRSKVNFKKLKINIISEL